MSKKIVVLGCTGSIGAQTLQIIREYCGTQNDAQSDFRVAGLSAHSAGEKLLALSREFSCDNCALTSCGGQESLERLIKQSGADIVVNGISGAAGLRPSIWALEQGMTLALANKETIVMAGALIKKLAKEKNAAILPVDSEHSALFHLIERFGKQHIASVILTASGGPFRNRAREDFDSITPKDALTHPTWNMGKKITVDSATLANKGLEVIEASLLFDINIEHINVVIHPQSMVHSLITTTDGVLYAQISKPDMRHPIINALTYPEIVPNNFEKFDITRGAELTFLPPRCEDFPMLPLAFEASRAGQAACIAYNAANEIAVDAFLNNRIKWTRFADIARSVIKQFESRGINNFDDVFRVDEEARKAALLHIERG